MSVTPYPEIARVDAEAKVRGTARFGADDARPGMLHGALAVATIGRGALLALDTSAARTAVGVRLVLTHEELADLKPGGFVLGGGYAFQSFQPMLSPAIAYQGQPIALVIADTLEGAMAAAAQVRATYAAQPIQVTMDAPVADIVVQADSPLPKPVATDRVAGDADAAYAAAAIKIDASYVTPPQHQNPMELIATVAEWQDGMLVIHEGTQNAEALRHGLARQLELSAERVQVVSSYVGGGFGQKNSLQMQTVLAAVAARRLGRPVKLVVSRAQLFHDASFRPATRQRLRLGADQAGRMVAAIHEVDAQTSRHDLFPGLYTDISARLHGIENFRGRERLVRTDVQTPGYMRTPYEHVASFAMECAVDELAYRLDLDPVALRLANDTATDPISKLPLSSRHMGECLQRGADRFGWSGRSMSPGSMLADDGSQVGWGVACGAYKTATAPAIARLQMRDDGEVRVSVGGHEMGQGIRTAIANVLAQKLGVPATTITIEVGVTGRTPQHLTAGSWGSATALPTVADAADKLLGQLRQLAPNAPAGSSPAEVLRVLGRAAVEVEVRRKAPGQPDAIFGRLTTGLPSAVGPVYPDFVSFSYVAHFVEIRVEPRTRRIRVPRVVSVVDCGRVVSPRTAMSQVRGGVVWGIGAALREESEVDPRHGGFLNANLADYVIACNSDIGSVEVELIDRPDPLVNSLGLKSLGEVVMAGVAPAIVNAVHHATGRRLRTLPMRVEHLL